jgi:serine/threonine protein kinase
MANTFVGTQAYMSPERMEGEQYSYEGDIWSLGIVLVELMTGKFPFTMNKGFFEMLDQIKEQESPNVPDNELYSEDLRDFISRCLKKETGDRDTSISLLAHPWILNHS